MLITITRILICAPLALSLLLVGVPAFAHSDSNMMGSEGMNMMEQMEDQMMDRMMSRQITPEEQEEMTRMMQDDQAGPGMMTMMMRMMMPGMMQQMMDGVNFAQPFHWSYWVTTVLVWITLALLIFVLLTWLLRKPS